jgi:hypothetical protein
MVRINISLSAREGTPPFLKKEAKNFCLLQLQQAARVQGG